MPQGGGTLHSKVRGAPGSVKCEEERAQWGGLEDDPSSALCISSSLVHILHPSPVHLPRPLPSFLLSAINGGPDGLQKLLKETSGQLQGLAGGGYTGATLLQLNKQVGAGGGVAYRPR